MKQSLDFTLPTRDATVGHWRFRGDLTDLSGNELTLDTGTTKSPKWSDGHTEIGITAASFEAEPASRAGTQSAALDFGSAAFTVEAIFNCTNDSGIAGTFVSKYDGGNSLGWALAVGATKLIFRIGDGTNEVTSLSDQVINDGIYHYVAVVCDRPNNQVRLYIDGVEDTASPFDISAVTGSVSSGSYGVMAGEDVKGWIDEICISTEVLTPADITFRAAGRLNEFPYHDKRLIRRNLRNLDSTNDHLNRYLASLDQVFGRLHDQAFGLKLLMRWDQAPDQFLSHLASIFGLELIDAPYATEAERRKMLANIVWIYQRRGTLAGMEKFVELLGYTATITEVFAVEIPLVTNQHRTVDMDQATTEQLADDFSGSNLKAWDYPLSIDSWWRILGGKLRGEGDTTDNPRNALIRDDSSALFYMAMTFDLTTTKIIQHGLGLYLAWEDDDNWLRVSIRTDISNDDFIEIRRRQGGNEVFTDIVEITSILDYGNGAHTLWVHRLDNDRYTIGIDDITLVDRFYIGSLTTVAFSKKGIWLNRAYEADITSFVVRALDRPRIARTIDPAFLNRKIQVTLAGAPQFDAAKRKYLERVFPRYVPVGIDIEWL